MVRKKVPVGSTRWLIFICVDSGYRLGHPAAVEEELGIHAIGTCGSVERQRQAHVPRMTGASSGRMAPDVVARRSAPSRYVHPSVMPTVVPSSSSPVGHDPGSSRCVHLHRRGPGHSSSVHVLCSAMQCYAAENSRTVTALI
jgi:hypothetical protein